MICKEISDHKIDMYCRALLGVGAMGAMAPPLFENMLIGTHTFFFEKIMNFRECGCQFTDSLGKSVDWHPHSQNSGQGPELALELNLVLILYQEGQVNLHPPCPKQLCVSSSRMYVQSVNYIYIS